VLRAIVLSIVLNFTAGANAALLCRVACHTATVVVATRGCHGEGSTSARVIANQGCRVALGVMAIVHEELRRGVSAPDTGHALLSIAEAFAESPTYAHGRLRPWTGPPLEPRPPRTVLRI
jgi:hypothetical protein